jgi:RNA polymerase sigma-70 factor (ECF subfamily)
VERHQRRAFAIAIGLVRDEQDAREIVQEAFLRVHRGLDSFEGGSSFFTWLYRIVTNLAIDLIRRPARRETEPVDPATLDAEGDQPFITRLEGADPVELVRRAEIRARLAEAIDALPPYHRGVILMREVEGMSYEEMAEAMAVSKGTIMSRLFHARRKLQRALSDCYEEQIGPAPLVEGDPA